MELGRLGAEKWENERKNSPEFAASLVTLIFSFSPAAGLCKKKSKYQVIKTM
jgi:hypothetical protein